VTEPSLPENLTPADLYWQISDLRKELRGQIVERERQIKRHRNQILFIAVGGLLGLLLVAGRGELNAGNIRDVVYQNCQDRATTWKNFNDSRESVGLAIIELNLDAPDDVKDKMMATILASRQPLPVCRR
jgi:hypothetical protein